MNTENELFGELHEQEENGLFGNEHRRQYEAQQEALRLSAISGSYIRIEIVDYFGTKKVIEVKPYFDKQQLTEIEFLNAIRLLEDEKNKATYAFW